MTAPFVTAPFVIAPSGPCRFALRGELDATTAGELEERLVALPTETSVVLDLSQVTSIDTAGLAAITGAAAQLEAVVILEAPAPPVSRFLEANEATWRAHAVVRPRPRRPATAVPVRHTRANQRRDPVLDWS